MKYLSTRADQRVTKWFGHMERMDDERMVKKIWRAQVEGVGARGRPRRSWMDGVRSWLGDRGKSVDEGKRAALDRKE